MITKLKRIASQREQVEADEAAAIAQAWRAGKRATEIASAIGRSTAHVRKLRPADVAPGRSGGASATHFVIYAAGPAGGPMLGDPDALRAGRYVESTLEFTPADPDLRHAGETLQIRYAAVEDLAGITPALYTYTTADGKRLRASQRLHDALFASE